MKKKILTALILACMTMTLWGCKDKADTDTKSDTSDTEAGATEDVDVNYTPSDYVTLGDYIGVDVELTEKFDTSDEAFYKFVDQALLEGASYEKDPDATEVKEDSIVNLDYMGLKDGEAFEGGTAKDQTIDVAGNCSVNGSGYIEGFTSGLVGAKVGETIDCDVTFPENYGSAELAGQQVVFRFTINYICKPAITHDDLTDDYVKENLGADSVEAYLKNQRKDFEAQVESQKEEAVKNALIDTVVANCTVENYPEDVVENRLAYYLESYKSYTEDGDVDKYIQENLGVTPDEFKETIRAQIKDSMTSEMVFAAIADAEGITSDVEGEYDNYIDRCHQAVDLCYEKMGKVIE